MRPTLAVSIATVLSAASTLFAQPALACYDGTPGSTIMQPGAPPCDEAEARAHRHQLWLQSRVAATPPTAAPSTTDQDSRRQRGSREMIGHHLRVNGSAYNLMRCPDNRVCPGYNFTSEGTGYTILGFEAGYPFDTVMKVRLDDGQVGYFAQQGKADDVRTTLQKEEEWQARCAKLPSIDIGATREEVRVSKWGQPWDVNTTETNAHVREQWVYEHGPRCQENGLPNRYDKAKYLYFLDGRLVTIQR